LTSLDWSTVLTYSRGRKRLCDRGMMSSLNRIKAGWLTIGWRLSYQLLGRLHSTFVVRTAIKRMSFASIDEPTLVVSTVRYVRTCFCLLVYPLLSQYPLIPLSGSHNRIVESWDSEAGGNTVGRRCQGPVTRHSLFVFSLDCFASGPRHPPLEPLKLIGLSWRGIWSSG
jgi:hypothetical protein